MAVFGTSEPAAAAPVAPTKIDATDDSGPISTAQQQQQQQRKALHVVFVHLDWGIGGAEQLMLQLCQASADSGHAVDLITTRCDPTHCFAPLQPGGGNGSGNSDGGAATTSSSSSSNLYPHLRVWGGWIPAHVFGHRGQALCSTLRLLYLAYRVARSAKLRSADVIVLDVLPTPLWILRYCTTASLLFYCHFPDQLLVRSINGDINNIDSEASQTSVLTRYYRRLLNIVEERSMRLADTVTVNSKFTRKIVRRTFASLHDIELPVLYPALDTATGSADEASSNTKKNPNLFVSLNRFERKKNLGLLIEAAAWMKEQDPNQPPPEIVIAGGYDRHCVENVEYRAELGHLAAQRKVAVDFRHSIPDAERRALLAMAAAVVYTPQNEHFGIVPLESMFAGTPVVAANSGGPVETVAPGVTGYLCEPTAAGFGQAMRDVRRDPARAGRMGAAGRAHVLAAFGPDRLQAEWVELLAATVAAGQQRRAAATASGGGGGYRLLSPRALLVLVEAACVLLSCCILTGLLRLVHLLEPTQSIVGALRKAVLRGEEL